MRPTILFALGLALTACGGEGTDHERNDHDSHRDRDADRSQPEMRAADAGTGIEDAAITAEGVVRIVGNDPAAQVVLSVGEGEEATQIAIVGEFRDELGRLSGVEVSIAGDDVANPHGIPERAIDVTDYDVISVNSAPVFLGVLVERNGDMWLDRENPLRLMGIPERLQNMAGAKVWVAGPLEGDVLRVQSYGVVREQ